jgi:hypothetical protein
LGDGKRKAENMKKNTLIICIVIVLAIIWYNQRSFVTSLPDEVEYGGEKIKLTKTYYDYDDYKDDPCNIDPSENAHVERLVSQAKIAPVYSSRELMIRGVFDIQFPGYGLTSFGDKPQPDGSTLAGFSIEIPRTDKERVLVFRGRNGTYTLIDDFITVSDQYIMQVKDQEGQLAFYEINGKLVLQRPLQNK